MAIVDFKPPEKTIDERIEAKSKVMRKKFGSCFYTDEPWLKLRYQVLAHSKRECVLCGSTEKPLHVDHIKPRSKYPELELDINNCQILCWMCNKGKGNSDEQDFRSAT